MRLREKLDLVDLRFGGRYENTTVPVPRLCIPALTLQDSPNGVAYGATGVTQLPAPLGVAASFDPNLAYRYGVVLGAEARRKGIDVVQGPELNLARVPEAGRAFEAYGEDPLLSAQLGVAAIEGIQSQGVMADAKHYTGYTQETARLHLDQQIPRRALEELYLPPFRAAVEVGHVASVMCAYGAINGVETCADPFLLHLLTRRWGFDGFVRSDLFAVANPVAAFRAGLDAIKPAAPALLARAVARHRLSAARLNGAVTRILTEMFAFHLIQAPRRETIRAPAATRADARLALLAARRAIVLLRNASNVLPLDAHRLRRVAVIGADAYGQPRTAGFGSAHVVAPFVITPLGALRRALGPAVKVRYAEGGSAFRAFGRIAPRYLHAIGREPAYPGATTAARGEHPDRDAKVLDNPAVSRAIATAARPGRAERGWTTWRGTLIPPRTGEYAFSLVTTGDAWLTVGRRTVIAEPGLHGRALWSAGLALRAHRRYRLVLQWWSARSGYGPTLGWRFDGGAIADAVRAARRAQVAIVFAADYSSEGVDRPSLALPGDENALISAVAAANPRTVVVLNTGGPVLTPWRDRVAALLEAWYPGEQDGAAIASVLTGATDPSGHLPVTFPTSTTAPVARDASWPGLNSTVSFVQPLPANRAHARGADAVDPALAIGYRYYEAAGIAPAYPFGFGLSYTSFRLQSAGVRALAHGYALAVKVRNTGTRRGAEVVQAYLRYPPGSGEPPEQLRAFARISLAAGAATTVSLRLPASAFAAYLGGRWTTPAGTFVVSVGTGATSFAFSEPLEAPLP